MILIMRNHVGEFVPGRDQTVVRLNAALIEAVAARVMMGRRLRELDTSLAELRYWDASPQCIESLDRDVEEAIEAALESSDGWTVLNDAALGSFEVTRADCTQMVVSAGDSPTLAWAYRVGSEPIRTFEVPLKDLAVRLGSPIGDPLGDPLDAIP